MFDGGDFATGNVRVSRDLRRRWNGNGNRNDNARQRRHDGRRSAVGNINVVGNIDLDGDLGDVGSVDILGHDGNVGIVGNVRLRLKQRCCLVESNLNLVNHGHRQHSNRRSLGVLRDRQSWGQSPIGGTDDKRIADSGWRGEPGAIGANDARCFTSVHCKHYPVKTLFICERKRP